MYDWFIDFKINVILAEYIICLRYLGATLPDWPNKLIFKHFKFMVPEWITVSATDLCKELINLKLYEIHIKWSIWVHVLIALVLQQHQMCVLLYTHLWFHLRPKNFFLLHENCESSKCYLTISAIFFFLAKYYL